MSLCDSDEKWPAALQVKCYFFLSVRPAALAGRGSSPSACATAAKGSGFSLMPTPNPQVWGEKGLEGKRQSTAVPVSSFLQGAFALLLGTELPAPVLVKS